ncbi:hypothetical protein [Caulobacter henricii]|uniref:Uncharacterized protein n=1 Tax=Caulobacter henricii TaxID=69395 RepID=A0A0P0P1K9_9CAUL|nr:hypothetical protein [Caulobacter henricii]ALL14187.1 hypothetical protein AQ619_13025 [Caulobacter henricii]
MSGLNGVVQGLLRNRPMSPRAEIEMPMAAYAFDAVESGGVIHFQYLSGAPVAVFDVDRRFWGPGVCAPPR